MPRLLTCILLALLPTLASAAIDWPALHRQLSDDPVTVARQAQLLLAEAKREEVARDVLAATVLLSQAWLTQEEFEQLAGLDAEGLQLARRLGDKRAEVLLTLAEARRLSQAGQQVASQQAAEAALAQSRRAHLLREQALAQIELAAQLLDARRFNEALPLLFEAHSQLQRLGDRNAVSQALNEIGNAYSQMENHSEAAGYYQRALQGLDPQRDRHALSIRLYNLGASQQMTRQYAQAERTLRQALDYSLALDDQIGVAFARFRLGLILNARGRPAASLHLLDAAQRSFDAVGHTDMRAATLLARAEALARRDAPAGKAALAVLAQARLLNQISPNPRREQFLHEAASRIYKQLGRPREALAELESWAASYRSYNDKLSRQALGEMQTRFDSARQQAENALLRSEQRRQAAELEAGRSRRLLLWLGLAVSTVLLLLLGWLLVRQVQQKRRFAALALHDELTGAPNRRHILAYGQRQQLASLETGQQYSLAVIDLDHFKSINDQLGHQTGDAVLRSFASAGHSTLRRGDRLGRIGGEEWLLVMPGTGAAEIDAVFQRLREAYRQASSTLLPADFTPSFSMGAAQAQAGESFERLMRRADTAMYAAKQAGRNQLCLAPASPL